MSNANALKVARLYYEDRQQLAGDIHDGFVQYGVGTKMWIETLEDEPLTEDGKDAWTTAVGAIGDAVAAARNLIVSLQALPETPKPLQQVISDTVVRYRAKTPNDVALVLDGDLSAMGDDLTIVATGVAHDLVESLSQRAGQIVEVTVAADDTSLRIELLTDSEAPPPPRIERLDRLMKAVGGKLITSSKHFRAEFPLP